VAAAGKKRSSLLAVVLFILLLSLLFAVGVKTLIAPSSDGIIEGSFLKKKVAVVRVEGVIADGRHVIKQLDKCAKDDSVKAIVLRIVSPGGGVAPSQEIHSAVRRANKKKPVIASMGAVAASGGYYIASACSKIVPDPGTITGSIGVIMMFSNTEKLMDKIGLGTIVLKSGKFKDTGSPHRPFTEEDRALMQNVVTDIYTQFITDVSRGRKIPLEDVRNLADGRIYTGKQAIENKLVDELGDMKKAVTLAGKMGGIEGEPETVEETREPNLWEYIFGNDGEVKLPTGLYMPSGVYFLWPAW